jgi:hypothetical protein
MNYLRKQSTFWFFTFVQKVIERAGNKFEINLLILPNNQRYIERAETFVRIKLR